MSLTYSQATDQMFNRVNQVWVNAVYTYLGLSPRMYWQGEIPPDTLPSGEYSGKTSRLTVDDGQSTLSTTVGIDTNRRYANHGVLTVELFCPKSITDSFNKGVGVAELIQNALRGKDSSGEVWLSNVRIKELSIKDMFYRLSVIADYQYDDVG